MGLSFFYLATRGPSYEVRKAEKWAFLPEMMEYLNEARREGTFGQAAGDVVVAFEFGHQGDEQLDAKGEKWVFWLFLRNCKATRGQNVWLRALRSRG